VFDDGFENVCDANTTFRANRESFVSRNGEDIFDLLFHVIRAGSGQVDFIDDGKNREIVARGEEGVGDGLGFDALAGVNDEESAFAGREGAGDLVREIDVAGSVDQVEAIFVAVVSQVMETDALCLDGDAALALQVHRIEDLGLHLTLGQRAGEFEQAVGERGLAVVDVSNDTEIADVLGIHEFYVHFSVP